MSELFEGANWYMTRRHYTTALVPDRSGEGKTGESLCWSETNPVRIYDQEHHDIHRERWTGRPNTKQVAALPLCKKCERAAGKLDG